MSRLAPVGGRGGFGGPAPVPEGEVATEPAQQPPAQPPAAEPPAADQGTGFPTADRFDATPPPPPPVDMSVLPNAHPASAPTAQHAEGGLTLDRWERRGNEVPRWSQVRNQPIGSYQQYMERVRRNNDMGWLTEIGWNAAVQRAQRDPLAWLELHGIKFNNRDELMQFMRT